MKLRNKIILIVLAVALAAGIIVGCLFLFVFNKSNDEPGGVTPPDPIGPIDPINPIDPNAPVIHGTEDLTLAAGTYCNFLAGVTAEAEGNDLTSQITVSGDVNTSRAGEYELVYEVSYNGKTTRKIRKITVRENPGLIETEKPTPVYESPNPYNVAKTCAAVSSADRGNSLPLQAFDGDHSTRWESEWQNEVTLTVDLGASVPVEGIAIYWEAAYAKSFILRVSEDGKTFTDVTTIEGQMLERDENGQLVNAITFADLAARTESVYEARFVQLYCYDRAEINYGYSIYEFEVYSKKGTIIPTEVYPILLDAPKSGSPDWRVRDEQWLLIDLGGVKSFDRMELSWSDWKTPVSYEILLSDSDIAEAWKGATKITLDDRKITVDGKKEQTVSARYVKVLMHERQFTAQGYFVNQVTFSLNGAEIPRDNFVLTASSERAGHPASLAKNDYGTFWASAYGTDVDVLDFADFPDSNRKTGAFAAKKIDLGSVRQVGRLDLVWNGSDGGKGKYYDIQISSDGESWKTVFRQNHGAVQNLSVYLYEDARYLRFIDYQNTSETSFMLEGLTIHSQYPSSSGEGKVEYHVALSFPEWKVIETENGSYVTGGTDFPTSRLIAYLDDSLRDKPVPSNDWWQGLLVRDKGYNMFMNPLTATFMSDGFWLTNPGAGYFSGLVPGNGSQTVDVNARDLRVGYDGMDSSAEVRVTGYTDYGITAVMTDNKQVDKLTVFLNEGALYAYCLFADPERATIWADGVIGIYDLQGNPVLSAAGTTYTGDCMIVCVRKHSGYQTGVQRYKDANGIEHENAKVYEERYYIVNVPEGTVFTREEDFVRAAMKNGNYLSVGAMSCKTQISEEQALEAKAHGTFDKTEAELMHAHGYAFIVSTSATYEFEPETNEVTTEFRVQTMLMRTGYSAEAYTAFLPHHIAASDYKGGSIYPTVRGNCRSFTGNVFITRDTFYGIVPTFAEPDDDGYSTKVMYDQLLQLYSNVGGDKAPEDSNLISGDPYWQGKNLHPMAIAALAADQLGATDIRNSFLDKIEYILIDWFTYDPVADASTGAYFYYDTEWGTLYYKNSEFGAGVNLADHYFTYGYFMLAAGVLTSYRPEFAVRYGDMIELLVRDYMNPSRTDDMFPYLRNFDPFAGHSWAGGYADNDGGNNQESAGEALNSWAGAYLYATAIGNEEIRRTAIYGFTTELSAIKHYWFDYFGDFAEFYQYGVAGQVYGGSNFYGTFFNGQPLYMYGIHLLPGQELLTSYALNAEEQKLLERMIERMRKEQAMWEVSEAEKEIHAWQHVFIPIVAIYDPDEAIEWYADTLQKNGNVGNTSEQYNVYWMIHGMKSMGTRTTDIWAEKGATATVYQNGDTYRAVCWNPTTEEVRITFRSANGVTGSALVPAGKLVTVDPNKVTEHFDTYTDASAVTPKDYIDGNGVSVTGNGLTFENGSAAYLFSCGDSENYSMIRLSGSLQNAQLLIDGEAYRLTEKNGAWETDALILTFRHRVEVRAESGVLEGIEFVPLTLQKADITGAQVTVSSDNNNEHKPQNAVDGNFGTRWESKHGNDDEWLMIELPEEITVYQLKIFWEAASARKYEIYFSDTGAEDDWRLVYEGESSQGGDRTDTVTPNEITQTRYVKILGISRSTDYGYSIYEVELYNFG